MDFDIYNLYTWIPFLRNGASAVLNYITSSPYCLTMGIIDLLLVFANIKVKN